MKQSHIMLVLSFLLIVLLSFATTNGSILSGSSADIDTVNITEQQIIPTAERFVAPIYVLGGSSLMPKADAGYTLSAGSVTQTSVELRWSMPSDASPGGYLSIYRMRTSGGSGDCIYSDWYDPYDSSYPSSFVDTGLSPSTTYYYFYEYYVYYGYLESNQITVTTLAQQNAPSTPTNLHITSTSSTSIGIGWSTVTAATTYKVYRSTSANGTYTLVMTTKSSPFINSGLTPNTTYYYKVAASNSYGDSAQSYYVSAVTHPNTAPSTPTNLRVTATSPTSISLAWNAVTGATNYKVYRSTSANGTYTLAVTTTSSTCTNSSLAPNTTYYYKVAASNSYGDSAQSNYVLAATTSNTAPSTPTNLRVTSTSSTSISLAWNTVTGAANYKVYRSTSANGTYDLITTTTSYTYTNNSLIPNTTYYYKVAASNSYGDSVQSSYLSAQTSPDTALKAPVNVKAGSVTVDSITVSWDAVAGASGYYIYRADSATGTYTRLNTINSDSTTYYKDSGLKENTIYYYKVSAFNSNNESPQSVSVSATTLVPSAPRAPMSLKILDIESDALTIAWDSSDTATGYLVYRSASENGSFTKIADTKSLRWTDEGLSANTKYYYKVTAYNKVGESAFSSAVSATTLGVEKGPTKIWIDGTTVDSITISWGPVDGATVYRLYRSIFETEGYMLISEVDTTSFTDTGLEEATLYYYKISAIIGGTETLYSRVASAKTLARDPVIDNGDTDNVTAKKVAVSMNTRYIIISAAVLFAIAAIGFAVVKIRNNAAKRTRKPTRSKNRRTQKKHTTKPSTRKPDVRPSSKRHHNRRPKQRRKKVGSKGIKSKRRTTKRHGF